MASQSECGRCFETYEVIFTRSVTVLQLGISEGAKSFMKGAHIF